MNYDPLITSLAPCDARCPPCPRVGPASLRVTRYRPASQLAGIPGPAVSSQPASYQHWLGERWDWHELWNNHISFCDKNILTIEWRKNKAKSDTAISVVSANIVATSVVTWTSLFWLWPNKNRTKITISWADVLQNIHVVTSWNLSDEDKIKRKNGLRQD